MYSIGASSRSPSPMTMVPSIGTESISLRIASTATASDLCRSPWPIVVAHAIAACSTTRRKSSERSESSIGRQLAASRPVGPVAEEVVGLHQFVDFTCPFVNHRTLAVAIEPPDGILVGVAVGTMDLHRIAGRALGGHGREPLRQPRFARVAAPDVLQPAGAHPQQARRLIVGL